MYQSGSVDYQQEQIEGVEQKCQATYNKRPGTSGVGQFYETKILTMVLTWLLHDKQIKSFYFGNNLDEAGAFDDLVVRIIDIQGRERVALLQAKHKNPHVRVNFNDIIKEVKGDFSIKKYLESYLSVRYSFGTESKHEIFHGNFSEVDLELVVFTPAGFSLPEKVLCKNTSKNSIFYTKDLGKTIQIECTEALQKSFLDFCLEWHKEAVTEILAKLILYKKYSTVVNQ